MRRGTLGWAAAVLALAPAAGAQTTGALAGSVADPSGSPVPMAAVGIRETRTNLERRLATDARGRYLAPGLEPGVYRVEVSREGFRTEARDSIELTAGRVIETEFHLSLGETRESVIVTAEARMVDAAASAWGASVEARRLESLPLKGRDLFDFAAQEPGATVALNLYRSPSTGLGTRVSVNGLRANQNGFCMDGIRINDASGAAPASAAGGLLGLEGIAELRIVTSPFSAEFGRAAGGVFTAVSRSGTNDWHGSAYEYLRNSALDAKNFFDPAGQAIPPFRRNQFGGLAAGPVRRDRVFFTANYEGLRERSGATARPVTLTAEAREGRLPGQTVTVAPAVKPYLELYPLPNGRVFGDGTGEFVSDVKTRVGENYVAGKVDVLVSERLRFAARYTRDAAGKNWSDPFRVWSFENTSSYQFLHTATQYARSADTLHNVRAGLSRVWNHENASAPAELSARLAFIPGLSLGPLEVTGLADFGGLIVRTTPRLYVVNDYQFNYDLTAIRSGHRLAVGAGFDRVQLNLIRINDNTRNGFYRFSSIANFLQGRTRLLDLMLPGSDSTRGFRQNLWYAFLEDEFRPWRRLDVTLGVRYETYSAPTEVNGKTAALPDPLRDPQTTVGGPMFRNPSRTNFAPRAALAWDPAGRGRTVIRAGAGIFLDLITTRELLIAGVKMPPLYRRALISNAPFPDALAAVRNAAVADSPDGLDYYPSQPYAAQFQVTVERQLGRSVLAQAGYAGSRGIHLPGQINNINTTRPQVLADGRIYFPADAPAVNPAFEQIGIRLMRFDSVYHGLLTSLRASWRDRLRLQAKYTWGKAIDNCSTATFNEYLTRDRMPTVYDYRQNRGLADFDLRHTFAANFSYQFSSRGTGLAARLLGGWEVHGMAQAQSGSPFNPSTGFDQTRLRSGSNDAGQRPDFTAAPGARLILGDPQRWFDPLAFSLQTAGFYGNLGRNTLAGPGLAVLHAALHKVLWRSETRSLRLRCEFFNLTNHPNFQVPSDLALFDSSGRRVGSAGRITETATTSRQGQIAVRWEF
jgi:hypothetical protein